MNPYLSLLKRRPNLSQAKSKEKRTIIHCSYLWSSGFFQVTIRGFIAAEFRCFLFFQFVLDFEWKADFCLHFTDSLGEFECEFLEFLSKQIFKGWVRNPSFVPIFNAQPFNSIKLSRLVILLDLTCIYKSRKVYWLGFMCEARTLFVFTIHPFSGLNLDYFGFFHDFLA